MQSRLPVQSADAVHVFHHCRGAAQRCRCLTAGKQGMDQQFRCNPCRHASVKVIAGDGASASSSAGPAASAALATHCAAPRAAFGHQVERVGWGLCGSGWLRHCRGTAHGPWPRPPLAHTSWSQGSLDTRSSRLVSARLASSGLVSSPPLSDPLLSAPSVSSDPPPSNSDRLCVTTTDITEVMLASGPQSSGQPLAFTQLAWLRGRGAPTRQSLHHRRGGGVAGPATAAGQPWCTP